MKNLLILILLLSISTFSLGQTKDSTFGKLSFTSYIGISSVTGNLKTNVNNGFLAMTGLEYQFKKRHSFFGEINFDTYKYSQRNNTYSLNGNLSTIALTLGYKQLISTKKLSPYFRLGAGAASVSMPFAETKNGFTSVNNQSNIGFQYQLSLGLNYAIGKNYGVFADACFQEYFTGSFINQNLTAISIRVGVQSSF